MTAEDIAPAMVPLIINGKDQATDVVFPVVSPGSGQAVWEASSVSPTDATAAVEAAQNAFASWSATKPATRRTILLRAADFLEARAEEIKACMTKETGAQSAFAQFNVNTACELTRDVAGRISGALSGSSPVSEQDGTQALVVKEPYGVVLGIAPWNAPIILGLRSVLYAIAAGNTCVLKGSELSPRCFYLIGSVFRDAGLPDGVLNVIYHRPQDAAAITTLLIEQPAVKKINFTGSTAVGAIIAQTAGRVLKPVLMELGGKNSAIVCEDADLAKASSQCALGAFLHAGQICMSTERILVHENIAEAFIEQLRISVSNIFGGQEAQTLAQPIGAKKIDTLVNDALKKGAAVLHGTAKPENTTETTETTKTTSHSRIRPFVLGGVTKDMLVYETESFGPHVSVIRVQSDDEAIAIANSSDYGLSGAVFTQDLKRGLTMAGRLETGAVHINSMTVHDEASLPHGGVKSSGWGRFNAEAGLNEFLRTKTITFQL
ncbi:salicylaldehyde dehydrogenase [Ophiostoma piceae UAMH 11346]|uniref:Salicylaldehyde dehydrogenase n=1 Tax=Ophiostoma piceae (strain UAMH 11346) TaxID=1262450 RepID=S3BX42_OPHP1|nr:salicylaldehyde dehydrogenase [Ophiostoma piceae UAMH 11346]